MLRNLAGDYVLLEHQGPGFQARVSYSWLYDIVRLNEFNGTFKGKISLSVNLSCLG